MVTVSSTRVFPARGCERGSVVLLSTLAAWPLRRWVVAVAMVPVLGALLGAAAAQTGGGVAAGPLWWALLGFAVLAGAGVLASYVPARGWRPELGCTPCAAVSALTLVGAVVVLRDSGADVTGPAVAAAVTLFGLAQRLSQPAVCPTPGRPRGD